MREKKISILLTSISVQQIFVTHCRFVIFQPVFYGDVAHLKRNLFSSFLPHYFISFGYHLIQSSNFDDMVC